MAIKYHLVSKKNLGKDQETNPTKMYVQPVYGDKVGFNELLQEIMEAGIPSNQVKGVIDRMCVLIRKHLLAGRIVQFGEFGNFRYGIGSTGSATEEDFQVAQIRSPRVLFYPGNLLRTAKTDANFEKVVPSVVYKECDKPHVS